jgi:hypothetical protein
MVSAMAHMRALPRGTRTYHRLAIACMEGGYKP